MTDRTYDCDDPRNLPYRFTWNPDTKEVFAFANGRVICYFENREAFHRFLIEGNKLDILIHDPIPDNVKEIIGE